MRVLPGDAMTAPRLPLLKSYSSRTVLTRFLAAGFSSGNQARPLSTLGVYDHQNSTQCIFAKTDDSRLALRVWIFNGVGHRIQKRLISFGKTNAVFAFVELGFDRVKFDTHLSLCIFNAYKK